MRPRVMSLRSAAKLAFALAGGAAVIPATLAQAAPVKGTVTLPAELRSGRRFPGYWRVENGSVPITPAANRSESVVVLAGAKGQAPPARTVTVEIAGLMANPSTVVVGPGSVIEFKNSDKVPHDLYIPAGESVMPIQRLAAGALRHQKFSAPGAYEVRCALTPHVSVSVVVVDTPHFAIADEKGAFKIPDAPDGKATLRVVHHGRIVHEEPVEVKAGARDVELRVPEGARKEAGE